MEPVASLHVQLGFETFMKLYTPDFPIDRSRRVCKIKKKESKKMLEELKRQVYEANMLLPKAWISYIYMGKCKWGSHREGCSLSKPKWPWIMRN